MQAPKSPDNEPQRLETLRSFNVLDTSTEERFDRITRMAKHLFKVPIALVSLVDENRQWFKSAQGLDATETPREISFCGHTILSDEIFEVPNTLKDCRFADNPLVTDDPNIRFYVGCPIKAPDGMRLGTLCLIDSEPRELTAEDRHIIRDLTDMVEVEFATYKLATTDELTNLSNRRNFLNVGEQTLRLCRRMKTPMSLLFFDLDKFKLINDVHGHQEGDYALKAFTEILQTTFRDCDVVARLGGDEFCVLCSNTCAEMVPQLLERLDEKFVEWNSDTSKPYALEYSVGGISFDPEQHGSIEAMLDDADRLMYEQKKQKKRCA